MCSRCSEDEFYLFLHGAGAEEEYHDQGVWEAHFGAVDGAIAGCFEYREEGRVLGVENYCFEGFLDVTGISKCAFRMGW